MKKSVEFIGTPSGDGESFCWNVDKDNYIKITGKEPNEYDYLDAIFNIQNGEHICIYSGDRVGLYPDDIFITECIYDEQGEIIDIIYPKKMKIKIEFEEI